MSELEMRVAAYLDGELSPEETRAFERDLTRPELARALGEELALRELIASLPEDELPAQLNADIETALGVSEQRGWRSYLPGLPQLGARSDEAAMPAELAVAGAGAGDNAALQGLSTVRYALGPLADQEIKLPEASLPKPTLKQGIDTVKGLNKLARGIGRAGKTAGRLSRLLRRRRP